MVERPAVGQVELPRRARRHRLSARHLHSDYVRGRLLKRQPQLCLGAQGVAAGGGPAEVDGAGRGEGARLLLVGVEAGARRQLHHALQATPQIRFGDRALTDAAVACGVHGKWPEPSCFWVVRRAQPLAVLLRQVLHLQHRLEHRQSHIIHESVKFAFGHPADIIRVARFVL